LKKWPTFSAPATAPVNETGRSGTLKLLDPGAERRRRQGADDSIDGATVSKKDQRRDAEDAKPRSESLWIRLMPMTECLTASAEPAGIPGTRMVRTT